MDLIRNAYHRLLLVPGVPLLFRYARSNYATVFMMHRFTNSDRGIEGFDPGQLRKGLDYLRRNKYELLSLEDLFSRLAGNGPVLNGAVVFTIDDGYIDHAEIAAPIFAEFDCPVTTFVTTGFLDGQLWMWWNKIEFIFLNTDHRSADVCLGGDTFRYDLKCHEDVIAAQQDFVARCKFLEDEEKLKAIACFAESAEVDLPASPPAMYEPMSWDDARSCERKGMTFGPHTVTHPVLSRTTFERAEWEINESWRRLCEEVRSPVPVFCYPNGQWPDFGSREIEIFRKIGLSGSVVGEPGFADPITFRRDNDEPYKLRRMSYPDTHSDLIQYVCGIERCKQLMRCRT